MFGDNRSCAFHRWFPIGRCGFGNQYFTRLKLLEFRYAIDDPDGPGTNPIPDGLPFRNHASIAAQMILGQKTVIGRSMYGLWSGLQDIEITVRTIFCPFDIHWCGTTMMFAIMALNRNCLIGKSDDFGICQRRF